MRYTKEQLESLLELHKIWLLHEGGSRANLIGADLTGVNLTGTNLYRANLIDADLTGANLYRANLYRANLIDADLTGANLYRANLTDADLTDTNLSGANLTDADLTGTNLSGANLSGANLSGADLTDITSLKWLSIGWHSHGECGRTLLYYFDSKQWVFRCGCFLGTEEQLRTFIAKGEEKYKKSRTLAMTTLLKLREEQGE